MVRGRSGCLRALCEGSLERLPEGSRGELIEGLDGALGIVLLVVARGEVQPKGGQLIASEHARQELVERDMLHLRTKRFLTLFPKKLVKLSRSKEGSKIRSAVSACAIMFFIVF
jgi:hypothetical protein